MSNPVLSSRVQCQHFLFERDGRRRQCLKLSSDDASLKCHLHNPAYVKRSYDESYESDIESITSSDSTDESVHSSWFCSEDEEDDDALSELSVSVTRSLSRKNKKSDATSVVVDTSPVVSKAQSIDEKNTKILEWSVEPVVGTVVYPFLSGVHLSPFIEKYSLITEMKYKMNFPQGILIKKEIFYPSKDLPPPKLTIGRGSFSHTITLSFLEVLYVKIKDVNPNLAKVQIIPAYKDSRTGSTKYIQTLKGYLTDEKLPMMALNSAICSLSEITNQKEQINLGKDFSKLTFDEFMELFFASLSDGSQIIYRDHGYVCYEKATLYAIVGDDCYLKHADFEDFKPNV